MTYRDTARAFATAERDPYYQHPDAYETLPLSEWSEARRHDMTPQTIAANHALHVSGTAAALRETLRPSDFDWNAALSEGRVTFRAYKMEQAARALLLAIGEENAR